METRGGGSSVTTVEDRWTAADLEALRAEYEPLRRFAAVIGRWDVEPDDLVQEAFAKVLTKQPRQIRDLGPYLRRMVANLATDERRRLRERHERGAEDRHRPRVGRRVSERSRSDLPALQPHVRALLLPRRGGRATDRAGHGNGRDVACKRPRRAAHRGDGCGQS